MSMVFCPECNQKVSQYADVCPNCGFPIKNLIEKQSITDLNKLFVCPKCAHVYYGDKSRECALHLKCEFCDTEVLQTDLNAISPLGNAVLKEEEKIKIAEQYGKNQFSQDEYDKRIKAMKKNSDEWWKNREQQQKQKDNNIPKCPKCGSTAIFAGADIVDGHSWGTMNRCANCGHQWKPGKKKRSWF